MQIYSTCEVNNLKSALWISILLFSPNKTANNLQNDADPDLKDFKNFVWLKFDEDGEGWMR